MQAANRLINEEQEALEVACDAKAMCRMGIEFSLTMFACSSQ
jgi:hypothetical protein